MYSEYKGRAKRDRHLSHKRLLAMISMLLVITIYEETGHVSCIDSVYRLRVGGNSTCRKSYLVLILSMDGD